MNDQDQAELTKVDAGAPTQELTTQPVTLPGDPVADQEPVSAVGPAPIEFSWQASEYVQHHKTSLWYMGVVAVVIALSIGAGLLHFWLSIGVFLAMGAAVIVYAQRPPRTLTYDLSDDGIHIDGKLFGYHSFHSFSVFRDVAWHSIELEPTQRFMPRLSVLFNDSDLAPIVEHLMRHLPRVDRSPDLVERATRYLRF